jgi:UDP-N-acetylmuramoyl-L-alanyl-D-glutamate--2,6-diaminopimelate ligase
LELKELLTGIQYQASLPDHTDIVQLSCHSKSSGSGTLFFAVSGERLDGNDFIEDARARGCRAVVSEKTAAAPDMIHVRVRDVREAMAVASNNFFGHPSGKLRVIGITGTNGKTTTAYLVDSIVRGHSGKSSVIGTIRHIINGRETVSVNTTPESFEVNAFLNEALAGGVRYVVMEVSSHALKLKKVHGMVFSVAVFTNITRDHMDFHKTREDYLNAKLVLFEQGLKDDGHAVINADDPIAETFIKAARGRIITFGKDKKKADIYPVTMVPQANSVALELNTPVGTLKFHSRLKGSFNISNIMAATGAAVAAQCSKDQIIQGIERIDNVDGRFESIDLGQSFNVIVDYAHTPDALENVLTAAKQITRNRLISVFGCGGDRDPGKRPEMGALSAGIADYTFITSDNPRTEQPARIIEDILAGIRDKKSIEVVANREMAIKDAIALAKPGDTVVIAGKGHEDYQIIGTRKIHFDDREMARKYIISNCKLKVEN